jgi:hypothetical protein
MEDAIKAAIDKLPPGYIMAILPFLVILAVWLFTHVRHDKQGRIYFYRDDYEKKKQNTKLDIILKEAQHINLRVLRLEILENIHNAPEKVEVISGLYDYYKKTGGDSYIETIVAAWRQKYAAPIIEGRI